MGNRQLASFPMTCLGFVCFESFVTLFHYNLLRFTSLPLQRRTTYTLVVKLEVDSWDFLGEDWAAKDVNHLQGDCAVDHELAVADESETLSQIFQLSTYPYYFPFLLLVKLNLDNLASCGHVSLLLVVSEGKDTTFPRMMRKTSDFFSDYPQPCELQHEHLHASEVFSLKDFFFRQNPCWVRKSL